LNFFSDVLPLIFSLFAIILVLYLCYVFSKYLSKKVNNVSGLGNIRILERVALTQDKGLAVVEVCGKYYLLGFSNNSVEILKELDGDSLKSPQPTMTGNFLEILNSTIKSGWDVKTLGRNFAKPGKSGDPEENTEKKDTDR
jgi:Flagellar biogenesis protein